MKSLTWMLVPFLALLQYEIWFAPGGVSNLWRVHQQLHNEVSIHDQWLSRNQVLTTEIHDLKNGTEAIEDHARNELGMIKTGEVFYQLPD